MNSLVKPLPDILVVPIGDIVSPSLVLCDGGQALLSVKVEAMSVKQLTWVQVLIIYLQLEEKIVRRTLVYISNWLLICEWTSQIMKPRNIKKADFYIPLSYKYIETWTNVIWCFTSLNRKFSKYVIFPQLFAQNGSYEF